MLSDYKVHCGEALRTYGSAAYAGLCTMEHFNIWLRAMKAKAGPGMIGSTGHSSAILKIHEPRLYKNQPYSMGHTYV